MYYKDNISKTMNDNRIDRLPYEFNPKDIKKKLVNTYFDEFRKKLFQGYIAKPYQITIDNIMAEINKSVVDKRAEVMKQNTITELFDLECYEQAYNEFSDMLRMN